MTTSTTTVRFSVEARTLIESHARRSGDEKHIFGYITGYHSRSGGVVNAIGAAKCKGYQEPRPSRLVPPSASSCYERQSTPNWNSELFGEEQYEPGVIVSLPEGLSIVGVYFTYTGTESEEGDSSRYISYVCDSVDEYLKEEIDSISAQLIRGVFLDRNSKTEITPFIIYPIDVSSAASTEERKDVFLAGISAASGYNPEDTRQITPEWVPLEKLMDEMSRTFAVLEVPVDFEISFEYLKSHKQGKDREIQNEMRKTQALRNKAIEIIKSIRWSPQNEAFFLHPRTGALIHSSESALASASLKVKDLFATQEPATTVSLQSQSQAKQKKPAPKAVGKGKKQSGSKKKGGGKKRNVNAQIDIDALLEEDENNEEADQATNEQLNLTGCEYFTELQLLHLPTPPTAAMESKVNLPFAGNLEFIGTHYYSEEGEEEHLCIVKNAFVFTIDAICYVDLNANASEAADLLLDSITAQILSCSVEKDISDPKARFTIYPQPSMFHFKVRQCPHIITCIFPLRYVQGEGDEVVLEKSEAYLREYRHAAHDRFFLPMNQPLLRKANSISVLNVLEQQKIRDELKRSKTRLSNVHIGLSKALPGNSTKHLVDGDYDYYHYRQDDMDDDGWGCAYRSLQTIISWFILQGYATGTSIGSKVPSHLEIQKALFELNDKPRQFVGSKEWIGAFEVSLCLQKFLGVTSKIMNLSSGSELANKGRELAAHFDIHGTPVMIGGGVLAFTLLGIDYNPLTGDIRFLILDPHYTGSDNLDTIQDKGWVGWKTVDLFRKDAFYNLCLPQRPLGV